MLEACFDFIVSVVNSLIPVSSMFAVSDVLAFLLRVQSNTTISTNTAIAKAKNKARDEADMYMAIMANLESTIIFGALVSSSGTTTVVIIWSFEVVSLPSDSVVDVGSFIVVVTVVGEVEPSDIVGLLSVVAVLGRGCTSTTLGAVEFSSSIVSGGAVLITIVVVGGFISV